MFGRGSWDTVGKKFIFSVASFYLQRKHVRMCGIQQQILIGRFLIEILNSAIKSSSHETWNEYI